MVYKKNDIVKFVSNQPSAHVIRMFGHYQGLRPEDARPEEYLGRVKSVLGDGEAYVVTTISGLCGHICILNADEIITQVDVSDLTEDEKKEYYERCHLDAPNVYDNDPSSLDGSMDTEEKCMAVATKAVGTLFPDAVTRGFESFGLYDYRLEKYIEDLDYCLNVFAALKSEARKAELKSRRDELESKFRKLRFKEYYTICLGVEEEGSVGKVVNNWLVAIDLHFEEVSVMRNTKERTAFYLSLGREHRELYEAKIGFSQECMA